MKQVESQSTHLEKCENKNQAFPPASTVKRCSRASRLHSPEQPATPVGSTRDTDVSDVESLCSVLSDIETPLTRSRQRAKLACRVNQGDEELSEVESCSSAISASSPGRKTRQSTKRKTISRSSDGVQGAVKMASVQDSCSSTVSTSSRVTRSQRKAAATRLTTKHSDDSELSAPDSCLSSVSDADVPSSSTRSAARPREQTGPIPISIDQAEDRTSLTPARQSSRVATRRNMLHAAGVSTSQSYDSEGFESGPTYSRENRRQRVVKTLDSDSDLSDLQSPDWSSCSKESSSHTCLGNQSPETPIVSRLSVKDIGVENSVELAEDTLHDSMLENTVIAEDADCTMLEEVEQDPKPDKVNMAEETKVSGQDSPGVKDAAVAARHQQEELGEENEKADTLELEEMQEKAARVIDISLLQGDKDDSADVEPLLCEEDEEMEARPVDSDKKVVECCQVSSSQEHNVKVDSIYEDEPEVITIQKKEVLSLLDSSEDEEEDEEDEDEEDEDEEREAPETEEMGGVPSSKSGAADMAVDGLFMIDTRPGQEADGQYYMEEVKNKKATKDNDEREEEEEFVDEEVNDDNEETDLLYSSRNPLL